MKNAEKVALFLSKHPKVEKVHYLGLIEKNTPAYEIYKKQYTSPGAMLSFDIKGSEKEAFQFLNQLKLIKLAVSLGSTESLVQHPATMTHVGVCPASRKEMGITGSLIRLSIGVENPIDLIADIENALKDIKITEQKLINLTNS